MTWDYRKFTRHPVAAEKFETRGRNNMILNYHYMVDTKLGKGVCENCQIPCECTACVTQLDKYWLPTIVPSYQPRYAHVENCYYNKIIEH